MTQSGRESRTRYENGPAEMRGFLFMVTVYVIESLKDQTWYTGMALNAEKRLNKRKK